jgi:predicted patatin/cPLA2 family phospholipase
MSVILAIRISSSVPIIFTPVLLESDYYIDGAFVNNFPIKYCNPQTTLGLFIKNSCSNKLTNVFDLVYGCMGILADTISIKDCTTNYPYIIEIKNYMFELTNFDLSREKKLKIINLGQIYAQEFINQITW